MNYDKANLLTPAKLIERKNNSASVSFIDAIMQGSGFDVKEIYGGVENTILEHSFTQEFEFDGFSVVVENGEYAVQFEDPEDGLVMQYLIGEGENEIKFPYLFEIDGTEKEFTQEDYQRIKTFVEGRRY